MRGFFYQVHRGPLKAAPQGAHRHVLRHAQHGILDTHALLHGAPRASSSRPSRGAPAYEAASARRTGYACSSIRRTARLFKSPHKGCTGMFCNMRAYWMRVLFLTAHGHEHQHGILIRVLFSAAHCAPLNAAPQGRTAGAAARPSARHTRYACSSIRRIAHLCKLSHKGRSGVPCGMRISTAYWIRVLFPTAHRAPL